MTNTTNKIHKTLKTSEALRLINLAYKYSAAVTYKENYKNQKQVAYVVHKLFSNAPFAQPNGNLRIGEFNVEFGNKPKALYYAEAYAEVLKHFHIVAFEEVDPQFAQIVAQTNDCWWVCSPPNSRGQGVAIVGHKRITIVGEPILYWQITNIYGIPDLRPALELLLQDTVTGELFRVRVVHLKSMRGGVWDTSPIRYIQCKILSRLTTTEPLFQPGDYNCFLNNTKDTLALKQAGWKLIDPNDNRITQVEGGRLNGIFTWNMPWKVVSYEVYSSFLDKSIESTWSDHSVIGIEIDLGATI